MLAYGCKEEFGLKSGVIDIPCEDAGFNARRLYSVGNCFPSTRSGLISGSEMHFYGPLIFFLC